MDSKNGRDELDSMLDDALACYSGAEPLAGLEDRVLHRVRASEVTRRRPIGWAVAFALAAALVLVAIVVKTPRNPAPKPRDVARAEIPALMEQPRIASHQRRSRVAARRAPSPLPKQEQFPAPAALTAEEQALRSFVERDPAEAQQVFAQLRKRTNDPIEIQPIQIAPLHTNGAQ
jgi:hypothetical protein